MQTKARDLNHDHCFEAAKPFTRIIGNLAEHQPSPIPIPRLPNSIAERIKQMQDG